MRSGELRPDLLAHARVDALGVDAQHLGQGAIRCDSFRQEREQSRPVGGLAAFGMHVRMLPGMHAIEASQ